MPPPPLYDSGALPPGIMDNTPRKRPRSNPSFGGVGRGSHLTPSPLGGRPGSALGGHHRHRADGRPSSALGGPPGLSIRKINFSTSPSPQPGAENGGGLAPRPTSAPAFRRCISPFGLFKPVATDASNSYLTAINALVNRPQVPLPAHPPRSSPHPPRISRTTNLTPHLFLRLAEAVVARAVAQLARVARAPRERPRNRQDQLVAHEAALRAAEGRRRQGKGRRRRHLWRWHRLEHAHAAGARPVGARRRAAADAAAAAADAPECARRRRRRQEGRGRQLLRREEAVNTTQVQLKNSVRTVRCAPPALEVRPILLRPCV